MKRLAAGTAAAVWLACGAGAATQAHLAGPDASPLVAALMSATPLAADLEELTESIGGRPTGSAANAAAVEWGVRKFREAGVDVRKEAFTMPVRWDERAAIAVVMVSS